MSQILSLSLRPRSLSALFGQAKLVESIRKHMTGGRPPQTWMFSGPTGTGKTTLARILAVSYQCQHMKLWGDPCDECWKRQSGFAIHEINASEVNGVEELSQVVEQSRYRPINEGGKRVITLDEAQRISNAAQNMLLAPTEKPSPHCVWIICTTEPNKILQTLRRRFTAYTLKGLTMNEVEKFLVASTGRAKIERRVEPLFEQVHLMGINSPAILLQVLEKFAAGSGPQESVSGLDESGVDSLRICKAVTGGKWSEVAAAMKDATPDSARLIRAAVSGWLVGCLKRSGSTQEQDRHAAGIVELAQFPFDDSAMMHWLWGVLVKVTRRYNK